MGTNGRVCLSGDGERLRDDGKEGDSDAGRESFELKRQPGRRQQGGGEVMEGVAHLFV